MRSVDVTNDVEASRIIDMIGNAVFKNLAMRVPVDPRFLVLAIFGTSLFQMPPEDNSLDSVLDRMHGSACKLGQGT